MFNANHLFFTVYGISTLDFHAPTNVVFNLQVRVTEGLHTSFKRRRRRLVSGFGFEKMRVATLHMIFSVTYCLDLHNAISFY